MNALVRELELEEISVVSGGNPLAKKSLEWIAGKFVDTAITMAVTEAASAANEYVIQPVVNAAIQPVVNAAVDAARSAIYAQINIDMARGYNVVRGSGSRAPRTGFVTVQPS
ncbi:MAG: hypothetical protein JKY34_11830 [Kordiimonadaceae bacterium]|nr:hypothetical protein [Kordiimonadaceae bacterium]